jgi:hypothetical protein
MASLLEHFILKGLKRLFGSNALLNCSDRSGFSFNPDSLGYLDLQTKSKGRLCGLFERKRGWAGERQGSNGTIRMLIQPIFIIHFQDPHIYTS